MVYLGSSLHRTRFQVVCRPSLVILGKSQPLLDLSILFRNPEASWRQSASQNVIDESRDLQLSYRRSTGMRRHMQAYATILCKLSRELSWPSLQSAVHCGKKQALHRYLLWGTCWVSCLAVVFLAFPERFFTSTVPSSLLVSFLKIDVTGTVISFQKTRKRTENMNTTSMLYRKLHKISDNTGDSDRICTTKRTPNSVLTQSMWIS